MCLAVPMTIKNIKGNTASAETGGVSVEVNTMLIPDLQPGEKVLVHAGFAIEKLDEKAAAEIESTWEEYNRALASE